MVRDAKYIGCAGWSVPAGNAGTFPPGGSHLERYAGVFSCVELNSSFYRPHRPQTYARWAASVPQHFRFAVKVPQVITHERRLHDVTEPLDRFLDETAALGYKRGPLLVQLPPSLAFNSGVAAAFFSLLRERYSGPIACEPRHASWFTAAGDQLLTAFEVARVAADPALAPQAGTPGSWSGLVYYRLHGTPRIYYSSYPTEFLQELAGTLRSAAARGAVVWCIFDNTAAGAATPNALELRQRSEP